MSNLRLVPLLALSLVTACNDGAIVIPAQPDAAPGSTDAARPVETCPITPSAICQGETCTVRGFQFPAHYSGWCEAAWTSGDLSKIQLQQSTCGDLKLVVVPTGDQWMEIYYDAAGALYAVGQWESDASTTPPCNGACRLACIAGPTTQGADALPTCATPSTKQCP
jgi:hypothetical protein